MNPELQIFPAEAVVVPRTLEPQAVNLYQKPVFTLRVENPGEEAIEVLPETSFWFVDYPRDSRRGFRARLELGAIIAAHSQAVLRFLPVSLTSNIINSGSYPLRLTLHVRHQGVDSVQEILSPQNRVRFGGNSGISPVESIGMGIQPGETLILNREGGYKELAVILQDMFPIDVQMTWQEPDPDWLVETDDGISLTSNGETILRQVRAWVVFGFRVVPPPDFPADQIVLIGTLIARRCPPGGDGLQACGAAGGAVRAVIAESAKIHLHDLMLSGERRFTEAGTDLYIRGTLTNPFSYKVGYQGPAGARTFLNGVDVSRYVQYRSFTFGQLEGQQSESVCWKFTILRNAAPGIYTIYPFFGAAVAFSRATGDSKMLMENINSGDLDTMIGVQIEVRSPEET